MLGISIINDLDIKEQASYLSKCAIATSANYIRKLKRIKDFILEKYTLYNNKQIRHYANIMLK
jgi:hypothetical protein